MNIQQHYRQNAVSSLNGGLAAFIPAILIVILTIKLGDFYQTFLFTIPFLTYSIGSYVLFLQYDYKAKQVCWQESDKKTPSLLTGTDFLLTFNPDLSLHILIFHQNGILVGEIKEMKTTGIKERKKYALYDERGEIKGIYHLKRRKRKESYFYDARYNLIGMYEEKNYYFKKTSTLIDEKGVKCYQVNHESGCADFSVLKKNEKKLANLKIGWLPLEWGKRFKDSNTPVLTFHHQATAKEKIIIFGYLANHFYQYDM
ncbi:hypothetical protein K6959_08850 [Bacillus aquiflavi]|uniref:hypothetical protein n=1 Tax=Bacillus aquiflavi TaxID=2672567 RepID=UPI001CA91063|nr:hypothetical protein [Bacillus aquiflavi]UAC49857.1 hypothetical protein K6959_08850 [Bacillus aquiflavi]